MVAKKGRKYILKVPFHILTVGLQWGGVGGGPQPEDNAVWGDLGIVNLGNSPFYGRSQGWDKSICRKESMDFDILL